MAGFNLISAKQAESMSFLIGISRRKISFRYALILSSASYWRAYQVDGLPRLHTFSQRNWRDHLCKITPEVKYQVPGYLRRDERVFRLIESRWGTIFSGHLREGDRVSRTI